MVQDNVLAVSKDGAPVDLVQRLSDEQEADDERHNETGEPEELEEEALRLNDIAEAVDGGGLKVGLDSVPDCLPNVHPLRAQSDELLAVGCPDAGPKTPQRYLWLVV